MSRPVVLLFCRTYLPGFRAGGPVRTLSNLVAALGDDFDFRIVTLDRDFQSDTPYPDVAPMAWTRVGAAEVLYCPPERVKRKMLRALVAEVRPDLIYLNSLMDTVFPQRMLLLRRLGALGRIPMLLAVRGQLNPGALALNGPRKKLYLAALKASGMLDRLSWHATGAPEAAAIEAALGGGFVERSGGRIMIAPNVSFAGEGPVDAFVPRAGGEPLRIALLGRISRMKNIDVAIDILAQLACPARLTLYGPVEDMAYWNECRARIAALPPHLAVVHEGAVEPARVPETLAPHDLFFLPTQGENFGHAIAEALAAGLPVVISDRTPWRGLAEKGVGADLSLDAPNEFVAAMEAIAALDAAGQRTLHHHCAAYAKEALADADALAANRRLLTAAIGDDGGARATAGQESGGG